MQIPLVIFVECYHVEYSFENLGYGHFQFSFFQGGGGGQAY